MISNDYTTGYRGGSLHKPVIIESAIDLRHILLLQ